MKKLNKIRLNDFREMSEVEMKNVIGGSSSGWSNCDSLVAQANLFGSGWSDEEWDEWAKKDNKC